MSTVIQPASHKIYRLVLHTTLSDVHPQREMIALFSAGKSCVEVKQSVQNRPDPKAEIDLLHIFLGVVLSDYLLLDLRGDRLIMAKLHGKSTLSAGNAFELVLIIAHFT